MLQSLRYLLVLKQPLAQLNMQLDCQAHKRCSAGGTGAAGTGAKLTYASITQLTFCKAAALQ